MAKQNMGMGMLAFPETVFKRKYRWTLALDTSCGKIPESIVKVANRPQLDIDETEINYLHGKMWIPGKAAWQTTSVTFYDVTTKGGDGTADIGVLYSWLSTIYAFHDNVGLNQSSVRGDKGVTGSGGVLPSNAGYAGTATLHLYDGCGDILETWILGHVWPQSVSFGELDYSSSDEATVEVTLRYSEVQYNPTASGCQKKFGSCACKGCSKE